MDGKRFSQKIGKIFECAHLFCRTHADFISECFQLYVRFVLSMYIEMRKTKFPLQQNYSINFHINWTLLNNL